MNRSTDSGRRARRLMWMALVLGIGAALAWCCTNRVGLAATRSGLALHQSAATTYYYGTDTKVAADYLEEYHEEYGQSQMYVGKIGCGQCYPYNSEKQYCPEADCTGVVGSVLGEQEFQEVGLERSERYVFWWLLGPGWRRGEDAFRLNRYVDWNDETCWWDLPWGADRMDEAVAPCQSLATGYPGNEPASQEDLQNQRAAYVYGCVQAWALLETYQNEYESIYGGNTLFVDLEAPIYGGDVRVWGYPSEDRLRINRAVLDGHLDGLWTGMAERGMGKKQIGIYTSRVKWLEIMGKDPYEFKYPVVLWIARYLPVTPATEEGEYPVTALYEDQHAHHIFHSADKRYFGNPGVRSRIGGYDPVIWQFTDKPQDLDMAIQDPSQGFTPRPAASLNEHTIEVPITLGSDDAGEIQDLYHTCEYSTTAQEIHFGQCYDGRTITSGFRFADVPIPSGAEITSAYIRFTASDHYEDIPSTLRIYGEDAPHADARTFSASSRPEDRERIDSPVVWNIPAGDVWEPGEWRDSPELREIVQKIVDRRFERPGQVNWDSWIPGNAMAFIVEAAGGSGHRGVVSYEQAQLDTSIGPAATLVVTYRGEPPPPVTPRQPDADVFVEQAAGSCPAVSFGFEMCGWDPLADYYVRVVDASTGHYLVDDVYIGDGGYPQCGTVSPLITVEPGHSIDVRIELVEQTSITVPFVGPVYDAREVVLTRDVKFTNDCMGNDHPDDNLSASSYALPADTPSPPSTTPADARVGVLSSGFFWGAEDLARIASEPTDWINIDFDPAATAAQYPVLVIPSGGLYGQENSPSFRARLEAYARLGGTIVAFAQQHGYEFAALPGGEVGGYGWAEDISCSGASLFMETWHPILSGFSKMDVRAHVDGYFDSWPEDAQIILSRKANGRPAAILYPYGDGYVFVTTMYDDWGAGNGQSYADARTLFRDLVTWAVAPGEVLELEPGEPVTFDLTVQNDGAVDAAGVALDLIDPTRQLDLVGAAVVAIPADSEATVPFTTTAAAPLGLWRIDAVPISADGSHLGRQVQVASYAVARPPAIVDPARDLYLSITAPDNTFVPGTEVEFTYHVYNYGDEPLVADVHYGFNHDFDWWGTYRLLADDVVVPAAVGGTPGELEIPFIHVVEKRFMLRGHAISGAQRAYAAFGVEKREPAINLSASLESEVVQRGDLAVLEVRGTRLWGKAPITVTLHISASDAARAVYHTATYTVPVTESSSRLDDMEPTLTHVFTIPNGTAGGTGRVLVKAHSTSGTAVAAAVVTLAVPNSPLSFSIAPPPLAGESTASLPLVATNQSTSLPVEEGAVTLTLQRPDGSSASTISTTFDLPAGASGALNLPLYIPELEYGIYTLDVVATDEYGERWQAFEWPLQPAVKAHLDKPSHRVRDVAAVELTIVNPGPFDLLLEVTLSPGLASDQVQSVDVGAGSEATTLFHVPIASDIATGSYPMTATLTLPGGDSVAHRVAAIQIPPSDLYLSVAGSTAVPGASLPLVVANGGGTDTSATLALALRDRMGLEIAGSETQVGPIIAGGEVTLDVQVPSQITSGEYVLTVLARDGTTGEEIPLTKVVTVDGLAATLDVDTDRDTYVVSDDIDVAAHITGLGAPLVDGVLTMRIVQGRAEETGWITYDQANSGLPGDNVVDMVFDPSGNKWFAVSGAGLAVLSPDGEWTTHDVSCSSIAVDSQGNAWCDRTSGDGVSVLDADDGQWTTYTAADGLASDSVNDIAIDSQDNLWAGTSNGLSVRSAIDGSWTTYTFGYSSYYNRVYHVATDGQDNVWVITTNGLRVRWAADGSWYLFTSADGFNSYYPTGIEVDPWDNVWVPDNSSVSVRSAADGSWSQFRWSNSGLAVHSVEQLMIDRQGNVWVTGRPQYQYLGRDYNYFDGPISVWLASEGAWTNITPMDGLPHGRVRCLAADDEGNVWCADPGRGVLLVPPSALGERWWTYSPDEGGLPNDSITAIDADSQNRIWVASTSTQIWNEGLQSYVDVPGGVSVLSPDGGWDIYTTTDGLAGEDATALAVDGQDNVWASVLGGGISVRWAGEDSWTTFVPADTTISDHCRKLVLDGQANLWCNHSTGVSVRWAADGTWAVFTGADGLLDSWAEDMAVDALGRVWFTHPGFGVSVWSPTAGTWSTYTASSGLPDNEVSTVGADRSGNVWLLHQADGAAFLSRFDGLNWFTYTVANSGLEVGTHRILGVDDQDNLWTATENSVSVRSSATGGWTTHTPGAGLLAPSATSMAPDGLGRVWLVSPAAGLTMIPRRSIESRWSEPGWVSYSTQDGVADRAVNDVAIGQDGSRWFATMNGVGRLTPHGAWITYRTEQGLAGNDVYGVAVGEDGAVWFATGNGVSRRGVDGSWTTYGTADGLVDSLVRDVAVGPDGVAWFATDYGLSSRSVTGQWTTYTSDDGLAASDVREVVVAPNGDVWAAHSSAGASRLSGGIWHNYDDATLPSLEVTAMAVAPDEEVWVATDGGIGVYAPTGDSWSYYGDYLPWLGDVVEAISFEPDGDVWLGFDQMGAAWLSSDRTEWELYDERDGMGSTMVRGIAVDAAGDVWLATAEYCLGEPAGEGPAFCVGDYPESYADLRDGPMSEWAYRGGVSRYSPAGWRVLWQATVGVSAGGALPASVLEEWVVMASSLDATGKLYLEGDLLASSGQRLAYDRGAFYVFDTDTLLLMTPDQAVYRPGQAATISGEVRNGATSDLLGKHVLLVLGDEEATVGPFDVPAGGSYPFSVSLPAPVEEGPVPISAALDGTVVEEVVIVSAPALGAMLSGPDLVGSGPFTVAATITNTSLLTLDLWVDFEGEPMPVALTPGEVRTLVRTFAISGTTTFDVAISGDVAAQLSHTVVFGEALEAEFAPDAVYAEGPVLIPYSLENLGQLPLSFVTDVRLARVGGITLTSSFESYVAVGETISDELLFDLSPGNYVLSYSTPLARGDVSFRVAPLIDLNLTAAAGVRRGNVVTVTAMVENTGLTPFDGLIRLETPFFETERAIAVEAEDSVVVSIPIDLSTAPKGVNSAAISLLSTAGQVVASTSATFSVPGADLVLTLTPAGTLVGAGEEVELVFGVRNRGSAPATVVISVTLGGLLNESQSLWLAGGEEGTLSFGFTAPDGLAVESITGEFWFEGERYDMTLPTAGVEIDVGAELNRPYYEPGDTARLLLTALNEGAVDAPEMYVHVAYAGEVISQPLSLAAGTSQTLEFELVASAEADPMVFYAVYETAEDRGVLLNTIYLRVLEQDVTVVLDSHACAPGDVVSATIVTSATGELDASGPGISTTVALPAADLQFTLPLDTPRGTHWLDYGLGGGPVHQVLFDVDAPWVRVAEARLLDLPYEPGDDVVADLTIASTDALEVGLRAWVLRPDMTRGEEVSMTVSLAAAVNNRVELTVPFDAELAGQYKLVYVLTAAGDPEVIYATGSESFDVGAVAILGLHTDKPAYLASDEPVAALLTVYAPEPATATLTLLLDGGAVLTEPVSLSGGVETISLDVPGPLAPEWHTLVARAEAAGLVSSSRADFAYGTGAADLAPRELSLAVGGGGPTRTVRVRVDNLGQERALATMAQIWEGDPDAGGRLLGTLTLPPLDGGDSFYGELTWDVLGEAGAHTLTVVIDVDDLVAEFYEGNNVSTGAVYVPAFDIALELDNTSYPVGEPAAITAVMYNLSAASETVTLTTTAIAAPGEEVFADERLIALPPGGPTSVVVVWDTEGLPEGFYSISAVAENEVGDWAWATTEVLLEQSAHPPQVDAGLDLSGDEGSEIAFAGTVADSDTPEGYQVSWDFGDGAVAAGTLTPTHTYLDDGIYTATLTVTDTTGLTGTDSLLVSVANVAPVVWAGGDRTVDEGEWLYFGGTFHDPGSLDTFDIVWHFGDGGAAVDTLYPSHKYAEGGVYTVTLTVTDDDGGVGSSMAQVIVHPELDMTRVDYALIQWSGGDPSELYFFLIGKLELPEGYAPEDLTGDFEMYLTIGGQTVSESTSFQQRGRIWYHCGEPNESQLTTALIIWPSPGDGGPATILLGGVYSMEGVDSETRPAQAVLQLRMPLESASELEWVFGRATIEFDAYGLIWRYSRRW